MLKIGRYGIAFGKTFHYQTNGPVVMRPFLFFWIMRDIRPTDIDKKPSVPLGTTMEFGGRPHRYYRMGPSKKE